MIIKTNRMKREYAVILFLFFLSANANAQNEENKFASLAINKRVSDYSYRFDLSTPLNSFITFKYLQSEGKQGLYRSVNSYRIRGFFPKDNVPDIEVKKGRKEALLQTNIKEIVIYKDSVAGVITDYSEPLCIITYLSLEGGKWLNAGEDLGNDLNDAREIFERKAKNFYGFIDKINELKTVSNDTASFLSYLRNNGKDPKEFVLQALAGHKMTVYGEIHRRKTSWDLLKSIINDHRFVKEVGTVFMELSSDKQDELSMFFAKGELDTEIVLDIFRSVQLDGWYDKGMYEFLIGLWKLNKKLPEREIIHVVAVDEPRPFNSFNNNREMEDHFGKLDRNEQMAINISETIRTQKEKRNSLFIVGVGHAYKSSVPGIAAGRPGSEAKPTAAAQLIKMFSNEDVFSIFTHCPIISNDGTVHGKIRGGLFDQVFADLGNSAIAFNLKASPFGKEPFDGIYEISYDKRTGSFENNYDAYLFLEPLESEQADYYLYEIVTDGYVEELMRRAMMTNSSIEKWFGVEKVTKEAIISSLKNKYENKKRWANM